MRYQAEVRHRPEVNDLLQHPLQGRLVGGSRRNVLDSVFEFDYLSENDAKCPCTSARSFCFGSIAKQERTIKFETSMKSIKTAAKRQPLLAPTEHATHDATM